jgi:hypothetical protein
LISSRPSASVTTGCCGERKHALGLEEPGALQFFGLGGQSVEKATIHG